jgi:hypothetical protein
VRLIAHPLQELQRAALVRQAERLLLARPVDLLEFLGQADRRDVAQPQLLQLHARRAKLAFAAVDEDEVGKCGLRIADCGM